MLNYAGGNPITAYNLTRSLRFRASASAYLNRTISSGTNHTWTYSAWVKLGVLTGVTTLYTGYASGSAYTQIYFNNGALSISGPAAGDVILYSTPVFRDPASWYHVVIAYDDTQATASNRVKMYVNGVQITSFSTATYPNLNFGSYINNPNAQYIGTYNTSTQFFDGYQAEVNMVTGQQLTPSSFGSTNSTTGVWQPAKYQGTYGTNGFYLPFTDNSALTTSSNVGLGKDFSGNGNYWTTNNISITAGVTYDSMTDVPTLTSATAANFCVGNPLSLGSNASLSNANLSGTLTGSGGWSATICGLTSGKWYWEATPTANSGNSMWVGFLSDVYTKNDNAWSYSTQTALYANDARNGNNASYGATWTTGDVIGVALDLSTSNGSVTFYKNGVSQGVMFSSLTSSARWRPLISGGGTGITIAMNFGQRPFAYTPPTGYVALNAYNLPDSTIKQGNKVMDATLYTGNGSTQTITNAAGFKPDLVWVKSRSAATDNKLTDSVRGVTKGLISNTTGAETTDTNGLTAFNSNGWSLGTDTVYNNNLSTYVGWQWQAGQGSSSSNTSGTITSTVSVNASAGFSVVTYTGTGANATVGHGLGVAPNMIIAKSRNNGNGDSGIWPVYHSSAGATNVLRLESANAAAGGSNFNSTSPTSSVFSIGTSTSGTNAGSSATYVAYCWSEIAGFSKFGSYTGNGSADGPFVYTGFRPKYVMFKRTDGIGDWVVEDTSRSTFNQMDARLFPYLADVEISNGNGNIDYLSNGFKVRNSTTAMNVSSATYIYAAFAENPFKNSLAR